MRDLITGQHRVQVALLVALRRCLLAVGLEDRGLAARRTGLAESAVPERLRVGA